MIQNCNVYTNYIYVSKLNLKVKDNKGIRRTTDNTMIKWKRQTIICKTLYMYKQKLQGRPTQTPHKSVMRWWAVPAPLD